MDDNDDALLSGICSAMQINDVNVVQRDLEQRRDLLTCRIGSGTTIVHQACRLGKMDIVVLFFGYFEADLEMVDWNGCTPLSVAVISNYSQVVFYLLRLGANVNHVCHQGLWPLCIATVKKEIDMVRILINAGANVHLLYQSDAETVLDIACRKAFWDAAELFIIAGANHENVGPASIIKAAALGHKGFLEALVEQDPSIAQRTYDTDGLTLLHATVSFQHSDCVSFLLEKGADMRARLDTNQGTMTPFHMAVGAGWVDGIYLMLRRNPGIGAIQTLFQ